MKWNLLTGVLMQSKGCAKINCPWSSRRSIKIRLMRGEPRLPSELYSPLSPEVNGVFMYMCCRVSTCASCRSPNRSSMVHTFSPLGISLSDPNESVLAFLLLTGANIESSLLLKSVCATTGDVAAQNRVIVRITLLFFIIF